ncbi:mycofactocin radical SAM maturase [Nocardia rhizosphaerae]|uniref:Mycofactocin radical SAM maturase n=1 Tax=Nocardia rhizosphaerae TaxID=1691571 RepID=A0ABV8L589_9NOCA
MAAGVLDLDTRWALHPRVSLRPESFGALLYHFGTRKLSFLKSRDLVDVVRSLPAHTSVREALRATGFGESDTHIKALAQLADTDMIVPAPGPVTEVAPLIMPAATDTATGGRLIDRFESGLAAPICLTWELTYACNLSCVHCLSSSGRRDPDELTTEQCKALIDEFERMQIFYVNIGGGEPTVRPDFWELVDYATAHHVGVKFSTNGVRITEEVAARLAASDYVDVQISLDGADAEVNDAVRGPGSYATAIKALENLANAGFTDAKLSVVATRHNIAQLDEFKAIADRYGATLRLTRLRPSGRGADVWDELHPLPEQQRELYDWLVRNGDGVLTGDSFFHLSAFGSALPGLNMCGAGRVVCLVDPVGDVYACPFAIHDRFKAGNIVSDGGFDAVWTTSELFAELREPVDGGACTKCSHYDACRGGCMAAKFFTGLPANGPDPECVQGYGEAALAMPGRTIPRPAVDHSRPVRGRGRVSLPLTVKRAPAKACNESPLG